MTQDTLLLAVDGGGTRCRARLAELSGTILGEGLSGPANLRLGVERSFASVFKALDECLHRAAIDRQALGRVIACLALAGASEPRHLAAAYRHDHPFRKILIATDAEAACIGAHGSHDGGIVIAGTGTVGWAVIRGQSYRVGGWGLPVSDEGSGAWLGLEALRRVLWAADGRTRWTPMLRALFTLFAEDPHGIVDWVAAATPGDFGSFAPIIADHAATGDETACALMKRAARHIDEIAAQLVARGADRIAIAGGLSRSLRPWLASRTEAHLVEPQGDTLQGGLTLARSVVDSVVCAA